MKRILLIVGVITLFTGGVYLINAWNTWRVNARASEFNEDIDKLFVGLQQYKKFTGSFPVGSNAHVARSLGGQNAKKVFIHVGDSLKKNDKGEFVDPWGTPLRIYFSAADILVRSAGPNKRFDDSTVVNGDDFYRSN